MTRLARTCKCIYQILIEDSSVWQAVLVRSGKVPADFQPSLFYNGSFRTYASFQNAKLHPEIIRDCEEALLVPECAQLEALQEAVRRIPL